jgi:hypothetical protein
MLRNGRYIPENNNLHNHFCEDLKSYMLWINIVEKKQVPQGQIRGYPLDRNVDGPQSRSGHRKKDTCQDSQGLNAESLAVNRRFINTRTSFTMKLSAASVLGGGINSSAPTGNMAN